MSAFGKHSLESIAYSRRLAEKVEASVQNSVARGHENRRQRNKELLGSVGYAALTTVGVYYGGDIHHFLTDMLPQADTEISVAQTLAIVTGYVASAGNLAMSGLSHYMYKQDKRIIRAGAETAQVAAERGDLPTPAWVAAELNIPVDTESRQLQAELERLQTTGRPEPTD